ncbi:hypothetical protein D3C81_1551110 [compost metagenome]
MEREARKASAAPWNSVTIEIGRFSSFSICVILSTAAPRDSPGARLNETVAAGNWPWWLTTSWPVRSLMRAMAPSGTCPPDDDGRRSSASDCGLVRNCGMVSSTTRYWLDCVKMVDTSRWPNAL